MNALEAGDDSDAYSNLIFIVLGVGLLYTILIPSARHYPNLNHIPVSGHNRFIPSCLDALRYLTDCQQSLKKGYKNFYLRIYKISTPHGWKVLVTGSHHIEELRKAPENALSLAAAAQDPRAAQHLFGHCQGGMTTETVAEWARHLTQNLTYMLPGIREEVVASLNDSLASSTRRMVETNKPKTPSDTEWHRVRAADIIEETVSRVVNRAFLGSSISHDKLYSQLSATSIQDAYAFSMSRYIASLAPQPLNYLGSIFSLSAYKQRKMRARLLALVNDKEKKPSLDVKQTEGVESLKQLDLLSRLPVMELVKLRDKNTVQLLVESSLKSMQTISPILLQVLRRLAASCEDAVSMRSEIERVVSREGWNASHTLDKFHTVDSFIKETMRLNGISALSVMRKTIAPFTFQDGTYLPPNTLLFSNAYARHRDASIYPAPGTFDGFRFSSMYEEHGDLYGDDPGHVGVRFGLSTASPSFLAWGHGRHACPGRFFASAVMKIILAEIVMLWDVRFEDGAPLLNDVWIGDVSLPNREAEILVRARPQWRPLSIPCTEYAYGTS